MEGIGTVPLKVFAVHSLFSWISLASGHSRVNRVVPLNAACCSILPAY